MAEQLDIIDFGLEVVAGGVLQLAEPREHPLGCRAINSSVRIELLPAFVDVERAGGPKMVVIQRREDHSFADHERIHLRILAIFQSPRGELADRKAEQLSLSPSPI